MKTMQELYVRKIGDRDGLSVWRVDGSAIRREIDIEFTNYGHFYRHGFIRRGELWIEDSTVSGEEEFFITRIVSEYKLMQRAANDAYESEKKARETSAVVEKIRAKFPGGTTLTTTKLLPLIHKQLLSTQDGLNVWLIDGAIVRNFLDIDFVHGGHELVYDYVPKNEVWLEENVAPEERDFVLFHELHERNLMSQGLDYDAAHYSASAHEQELRKK